MERISPEARAPPDACDARPIRFPESGTHRPFRELSLQGSPVHAESARGFGNIAIALRQHLLDVLPFDT